MNLGSRGESLIKSFETLRLTAYKPTPNDVWTIGYGSTRGVKEGMVITKEDAESLFRIDVDSAVASVRRLRQSCPLTQSMFDALVSLVFNVGPRCIEYSSQYQSSIGRALLKSKSSPPDYYLACQSFFLWRKQGGHDLLGLARRRVKEMVLFLEDGLPK